MNGAAIFFLPKQIRTIVKNFYFGERRPSNRTMTSPKNGEKMFFIVSWRVLNILRSLKLDLIEAMKWPDDSRIFYRDEIRAELKPGRFSRCRRSSNSA